MEHYIEKGNIKIADVLYEFVNKEVLPGTDIERDLFWDGLGKLISTLVPENKELLKTRDHYQETITNWLRETNQPFDLESYKRFLIDNAYLEDVVEDFHIQTKQVDNEIRNQAGPQLVVPLDNERYAINAVNARWGSLYDALYGSDVISIDAQNQNGTFSEERGKAVISHTKTFLNEAIPFESGTHEDVIKYEIKDGVLQALLKDNQTTSLVTKSKFVGYQGSIDDPSSLLFKNNGLHIDLQIDRDHSIGKLDSAGIKDIVLESAVTTIMDCEDSIVAVDAEDKVKVYKNWLGLIKGTLTATFTKNGKEMVRTLNPDRTYLNVDGGTFSLSGRSLMFIRNVGHLMTTDAILDKDGNEVPEGIVDCVMTSLIAKHDLMGNGTYRNSKEKSIYIVKPKMHGSAEVAFANKLFAKVETLLNLDPATIKIGVMDEERRTSLNLKNCIFEVKDRIAFINTGFLDRTGDEIHTSMDAGPMILKQEMKSSEWLNGYEQSNVSTGVACGLKGSAQIGKGMWAMPDQMQEMMNQKGKQLEAGANTAWVPSPTAATLHAIHYHQINVKSVQEELKGLTEDFIDQILVIPTEKKPNWSQEAIQSELDNNIQGILGYVVKWVNQGIGCSKVKDINNVGLMEDRATLRISSQHIANWLHHNVCSEELVLNTFERMAGVVDSQNEGDQDYEPLLPNLDESIAYKAAVDLVLKGYDQPNGYTEPILHERRKQVKEKKRSVSTRS